MQLKKYDEVWRSLQFEERTRLNRRILCFLDRYEFYEAMTKARNHGVIGAVFN